MPEYIRDYTSSATYFFTLVAFERRQIFCNTDFLQAFRASIKQVQQEYPFEIIAWVQLPDHLHCIWHITEPRTNYNQCWSQIKRQTTLLCPQYHLTEQNLSHSKNNRQEKGIFQRRFFEHRIRDEKDFKQHMDYLHYNPVKHRLVKNVQDWKYSSFHQLNKQGFYPIDWGNDMLINQNFNVE